MLRIANYIRIGRNVSDGNEYYNKQNTINKAFIHDNYKDYKIYDYVDICFSAMDKKRPNYQQLIKDIKNNKINIVIVSDYSKLTRRMQDSIELLELLDKKNVKLFESTTGHNISKKMIFNSREL